MPKINQEEYGYIGWKHPGSKETEVKSKQELIEKWGSATEAAEFYGKGKEERLISYMKDFVSDLNQLDEPETLSLDWIDDNKKDSGVHSIGYYVPIGRLHDLLVPKQEEITEEQAWEVIHGKYGDETLQNNIDYVESQGYVVIEKPTIPNFVAEFLIGKEDYMLYELLDDEWLYKEHDRVAKWLYDNDELTNRQREIDLVMARDRGCVVEEEQKYYVLDSEDIPLLERANNQTCKTTTGLSIYEDGRDNSRFELTEQEIKGYDIRYWAFAVKVEELEE